MHPDAIENYEKNLGWNGKPLYSSDMSDKEVVLSLWSDTAYGRMTGDKMLENISPRRRKVIQDIFEASRLPKDQQDDAYAKLRATFEAEGWMRDPVEG